MKTVEMRIQDYRDRLARRARVLAWAFVGLLGVVAAGYAWVQVREGDFYRELALNNSLRREPVRAARGPISTRAGELLAENVPSYSLLLWRERTGSLESSLEFAAAILGQPRDQLRRAIEAADAPVFRPVLIAEELSLSEVARFSAVALERPEFEVRVEIQRLYRYGPLATHLVGWLGEVNREELVDSERRLARGDLVGRRGVERVYDARLRGENGQREVVVDSYGRPRRVDLREPTVTGTPLRLNVDLELQQAAQRLLAEEAGAVVALDPRDGAVRALASSPTYDPNMFARRLNREQWRTLMEHPRDPLNNRALQSAQSPGSVFKVVVAAAGLGEGVITPQDRVFCSGSAEFYGARRRCWKAGGHGWMDLRSALVNSCDVYFYELGQKLGVDRIATWAERFGFGSRTGIDLDGEVDGNVPSTEWAIRQRGAPWYPGETISVAIGQGPLQVTPVQAAVMTAAVANGGELVTPRLAADARPDRSATGVSASILARLREALWAVVNERGTGASARVPGLAVAGKTGTVQVVAQSARIDSSQLEYRHRDHAWFTSFAPVDSPELVIVVYVEHGGRGSRAAAPIAQRLYEIYFRHRLETQQAGG